MSIALATYNGARYLKDQLESFVTQNTLPDELVVSDDCSSDDTLRILNTFKERAPFAVHIHRNSSNIGFIRNFERAISLCSADIVFLSDQDDVWFPGKIATVIAEFSQNPHLMVVLNDQIIADENLAPSATTKLTNIARYGAPQSHFITGCCSAHRKEWQLVALPIPETAAAHDSWINGLAHELKAAKIIQTPLQLYRRHERNASHSIFSSTRQLGLLDRVNRFRSADVEIHCRRVIENDTYIIEKLAHLEEFFVDHDMINELQSFIRKLRGRETSYRNRADVLHRRGIGRIVSIYRLWLSGGYGTFNGWKSALRDAFF